MVDEADPHFCAMVNAARDEHFRLKGFHPYTADIIAMLKAALSVPSKPLWPKEPPATGANYSAGLWSRRNYAAMIEDFEAGGGDG